MKNKDGSDVKVVIVEEEKAVRNLLKRVLEKADYKIVSEFSDGLDCMHYLAENKVDLVLCDGQMPCSHGIDVLRRLRTDSVYQVNRDVPFILVSGIGNSACVNELAEYKGSCLTKPFKKEELFSCIDAILQH